MYGTGRFVLELLRGDHILTVTGFTVSQNMSLLMVLAGALSMIFLALRERFVVKACTETD